jgi:hypothetical protein
MVTKAGKEVQSKHNCLGIVFIGLTVTTCFGRAWPSSGHFILVDVALTGIDNIQVRHSPCVFIYQKRKEGQSKHNCVSYLLG